MRSLLQLLLQSSNQEETKFHDEIEAFNAVIERLLQNGNRTIIEKNMKLNSCNYSKLSHLYQSEVWDCGIACILMVLRWLRPIRDYPFDSSLLSEELENRKILLDNIGTKSIWTADLVLQIHQLFEKQRTAKYLFCSKIMGVDGNYQDVRYYRAAFGSDQARLRNTFKELDRLGASTFCTPHIPLTSILNLVSHEDCLAIVLVDNSALVGSRGVRDIVGEDQYIGHYVILCGISTDKESLEAAKEFDGNSEAGEDHCLVMYNPGHNNPRIMFVTPSRFQRARSAKGTDEDIIFIFRQSSDAGQDYTDPFIDSKKTKT